MQRHASIGFAVIAALAAAGPSMMSQARADSPSVVSLDRNTLRGEGLERIPAYKKELTVSGMQQLSTRELFSGAFIVDVWASKDGGTLLLKDYPFDQYVQVLQGTTKLVTEEGAARFFAMGDSFVVPRGFRGTWTVSKDFREVLIIESKSLEEGIGEFE
ncbi:MAG TPA: cupin domain-containing protein [Steroidobacteraceae bacterium]|nr:cupin domain-containing protein [Steroidobacteraceae bacterium]